MHVRDATLFDAPRIAALHVEGWRAAYRSVLPPAVMDDFSVHERERFWTQWLTLPVSPQVVCVAERSDGDVGGFAAGGPERTNDPTFNGELYALHVAGDASGEAVGRRLVGAVIERLADRGMTSVMVWAGMRDSSRALFEDMGGRMVRLRRVEMAGALMEEVAYGWMDTGALVVTG